MRDFDIYCDSGANIPFDIVEERGIKIIPYNFTVNGEERCCYGHGVNFAEVAKKFYDDVRAGAEVKTSLMSMQTIMDAVEPSLQNGRDVFISFISSGISGTYNQACEAAKQLEAKYPGSRVVVCDSANASMGEGLQVLKVCDLHDMGESIETCEKWVEENRYKINSYLTVGDLKYLKKSGRISTTVAIAGTILNIKPVLRADGDDHAKIVFHARERGRKRAIQAVAENFAENVVDPGNQTVAICHADSEEDANYLAELIKEKGAKDVIIEYYDLCTGSHVGPGTVALFFYGKDRKTGIKPKQGILDKFKNVIRKHEKSQSDC